MSTIANVERKMRRVEGFDVRILHLRGADVRGDRAGMPQYAFRQAAAGDITVEHWKETRFRPMFPGFTKGPVRENCTPGSVRGLLGNWQSYRDLAG